VTNNYILRRLRYTFDFNDAKMMELWAQADQIVTREQVSTWLKKDDDPGYENCSDRMLAVFLNGLINDFRGKKDGPQKEPESRINNNIILRKLKIALNFKDDDVCEIMELAGMPVGKSELSAFFRRVGHHHYRELQDQMLRKFMQGLQAKHRDPNSQTKNKPNSGTLTKAKKKPEQDKTESKNKPSNDTTSDTTSDTDSAELNSHIWGKK